MCKHREVIIREYELFECNCKKKKEKDYVKFCKRTAKKTPVYVGIIT